MLAADTQGKSESAFLATVILMPGKMPSSFAWQIISYWSREVSLKAKD